VADAGTVTTSLVFPRNEKVTGTKDDEDDDDGEEEGRRGEDAAAAADGDDDGEVGSDEDVVDILGVVVSGGSIMDCSNEVVDCARIHCPQSSRLIIFHAL
jgi:hypothetical protein